MSPFMEYMKVMSDSESDSDDDASLVTEPPTDVVEAEEDSDPSKTFPVEILPSVLAFCPMSSLLAMRAVNKAFRNKFSVQECAERHANILAAKRAKARRKKKKTTTPSTETATTTVTQPPPKKKTIVPREWGIWKNATIEKVLEVANEMFFETRDADAEADANENDNERVSVLIAEGFDEANARKTLQKDGVIFHQEADEEDGRPGKFWRIEAHFQEVPLYVAIRAMKSSTKDCRVEGVATERTYRLLSAPHGSRFTIAEYDVSIRKQLDERVKGRAAQQITYFDEKKVGWIGFPLRYTIKNGVVEDEIGE